jgi:hypothetical protein
MVLARVVNHMTTTVTEVAQARTLTREHEVRDRVTEIRMEGAVMHRRQTETQAE